MAINGAERGRVMVEVVTAGKKGSEWRNLMAGNGCGALAREPGGRGGRRGAASSG